MPAQYLRWRDEDLEKQTSGELEMTLTALLSKDRLSISYVTSFSSEKEKDVR